MRVATLGDRTSESPDAPKFQPIVVRESGYRRLRESTTVGPCTPIRSARRSPTATTAEAPSANSALPTMVAIVGSAPGTSASTARPTPVRRHIIGRTAQVVVQPPDSRPLRPRSPGRRSARGASGRRPSRPAMRASNDGTANPVTVVVTIRSTSSGVRPASSSALDRAAHRVRPRSR